MLLSAVLVCCCFSTLTSLQGAPKPVMVHYMPWFATPPGTNAGGWHWTMNHFYSTNALGQPQIASWYYPIIGPYDSLDPAVLEYHVLLMKLAGVDGVIADWYGTDEHYDYAINNERTLALFQYVRKAGLKFSLCYEDHTIQIEIKDKYIEAGAAVAHAQQTMLYAQINFFTDPSYLRLNRAPVLLNFGPQYFKNNSEWVSIFSVLDPSNRPALFTEDDRLPAGKGAFDWPPMWMSGGGTNTLTPAQLQSYLVNFSRKANGWPNYISSAFPRFHDIYAQAGAGSSYGVLEDANGATLTSTLSRALTNDSAIVQIVTWNDFGEGTIIEPTRDYGYRDLGIVQDLRRRYLDPGFSYTTNDLAMAFRFYTLRKLRGNDPIVAAELDRIFANIVSGKVSIANRQLTRIESTQPVVENGSPEAVRPQSALGPGGTPGSPVHSTIRSVTGQAIQAFVVDANLTVFHQH